VSDKRARIEALEAEATKAALERAELAKALGELAAVVQRTERGRETWEQAAQRAHPLFRPF